MNNKIILGALLFLTHKSYSAIDRTRSFNIVKPNTITVAVIDTGADIEHKDLKDFIWTNPGETGLDKNGKDKSNNAIDDDGNGFVDDLHGWNFVNNTNNVFDSHGHGTHISGVIKKEFQRHSTNSTLSPSVRLMILKYYNPDANDFENVQNTTKAIEYATLMQARIINYSGGGTSQYIQEFKALQNAIAHNILIVAAAGNNKMNTDSQRYYPANYPLQHIISVAASDNDGELTAFSNYGSSSVDIAAPGKDIYSTLPQNSYGFMSGTSQSTAYVTGVAASLMAKKTNPATLTSILVDLLATSKFNKSLKGKTKFQMAMVQ